MVPMRRDDVFLGSQRIHMLSADAAFRLTALSDGAERYEPHLRSLLQHSTLQAVQWINLARHQIQFVTLER